MATLERGVRLGPYEIETLIGAGGMGEVYRARDSRLDRTVALKVLPPATAESAEALARFEREARTISQLSHPHICPLFDVGDDNGVRFIVMPLLDGQTLADRLANAPLSPDVVIRYATETADALDAAHRAGIVHRDLKPGNVMVTRSGVKLLDFGLAKSSQPAAAATLTPTVAHVTKEGAVAGTVAYMAPELLEGQPADERSDIYALGAVVYEMATGRRYFTDPSRVLTPAPLDRIVRGCLSRDPDERWQSARDVRLQLASVNETATASMPNRSTSWLPWAVAACALAVAVGTAAWAWSRGTNANSAAARTFAFDVAPPEGGQFVDSVESSNLTVSPDGSQLAFVASDRSGVTRVWVRPLTTAAARPVPGTEGARHVFWAPTGRSLGFAVGDKLKRLDLPDGAPVTLTTVPDVRIHASWGDGQIAYSILPGAIFTVPVAGGQSTVLVEPDRSKGDIATAWPWFLPDGKRLLYLVRHGDGSGVVRLREPGKPARDVVQVNSMAQILDGRFVVFARESTLMAQRFDPDTVTTSGDPIAIAEPVRYFQPTGAATFSVSQTGVIAYQSHTERGRLVWLDRSGRETDGIEDDSGYSRLRISPDGRRLLFSRVQPRLANAHIWSFDVERRLEQRLSSDMSTALNPVWLPDGSGFLFSGRIPPRMIRKDLATGEERELLRRSIFNLAEDISPDGKTLLYTQRTSNGAFDIWTMPLDDPSRAAPLAETPFDEASVRFSRDARYFAYAANELGSYEVFVQSYPRSGAPVRVSTGGGMLPRWSRDGRELFYLSGDGWLVTVPVTTTPAFSAGPPRRLFAIKGGVLWGDIKSNAGWPDYDLTPDGSRFVAVVPQAANEKPITVLINANSIR